MIELKTPSPSNFLSILKTLLFKNWDAFTVLAKKSIDKVYVPATPTTVIRCTQIKLSRADSMSAPVRIALSVVAGKCHI